MVFFSILLQFSCIFARLNRRMVLKKLNNFITIGRYSIFQMLSNKFQNIQMIQKNSNSCERHLLRVVLEINYLNLFINFPSSAFFVLTIQDEDTVFSKPYQLVKGEASLKVVLDEKIQVMKIKGDYSQNRMFLKIFLETKFDKILAGRVPITIEEDCFGQVRSYNENINHCMNKNAYITYKLTVHFVTVIHSKEQESEFQFKSNKLCLTPRSFGKEKLKLVKSEKNLFRTKITQFSGNKLQKKSSRAKHKHKELSIYSTFLDRKVQQDCSSFNPSQEFTKWRKNETLKQKEIDLIYENLKNERSKNFYLSKRQKQLLGQKKALQQELDMKRSKESQFDTLKMQISLFSEKQSKIITFLQSQIGKYKERIKQMEEKMENFEEKKVYEKSNFDSQFDQLYEKYKKVQKQKIQLLQQYNGKLGQFEKINSQDKIILGQKQKELFEEKLKLEKIKKKLQNQHSQYQQLSRTKEKLQNQLNQMKQGKKKEKNNCSVLQEKVSFLSESVANQEQAIKDLKERNIQLQRKKEEQRKEFEEKIKELSRKSEERIEIMKNSDNLIQQLKETIEKLKSQIKKWEKQQVKESQVQEKIKIFENEKNEFFRINAELNLQKQLKTTQYEEQIEKQNEEIQILKRKVQKQEQQKKELAKLKSQIQVSLKGFEKECEMLKEKLVQSHEFLLSKQKVYEVQMNILTSQNIMFKQNNEQQHNIIKKKNQEIQILSNLLKTAEKNTLNEIKNSIQKEKTSKANEGQFISKISEKIDKLKSQIFTYLQKDKNLGFKTMVIKTQSFSYQIYNEIIEEQSEGDNKISEKEEQKIIQVQQEKINDRQKEKQWLVKENLRINEEITYLRNVLMAMMQNPEKKFNLNDDKVQGLMEFIVQNLDEVSQILENQRDTCSINHVSEEQKYIGDNIIQY